MGEPSLDVACSLVQHVWRVILPIVDVPSVTGGVKVGQEGSDDREVRGEIVIHVLGLPGEILGGDDPVGPHLQGEWHKVLRSCRGASAMGPPACPLSGAQG